MVSACSSRLALLPHISLHHWLAGIAGLLGLAVAPCAVGAEISLEQQLTGGSSRAWTLHEVVRPPLAGDGCTSGATYTFAASHDLQVTQCQHGHLVASHHAWTVRTDQEGALTLVITGVGTYAATVRDARPGPRRLRLHPWNVMPGWPVGDEELHMDDD